MGEIVNKDLFNNTNVLSFKNMVSDYNAYSLFLENEILQTLISSKPTNRVDRIKLSAILPTIYDVLEDIRDKYDILCATHDKAYKVTNKYLTNLKINKITNLIYSFINNGDVKFIGVGENIDDDTIVTIKYNFMLGGEKITIILPFIKQHVGDENEK